MKCLHGVRGKGLMIALEFGPPKSMASKNGLGFVTQAGPEPVFCQAILIPLLTDHRVLAQVAGHHQDVIKLIPPLVLSESDDVDEIIKAFDAVIGACHKFPGPVWEVGKRLVTACAQTATQAGESVSQFGEMALVVFCFYLDRFFIL